MSPTNPIVARLDKLHDQWVTFARDPHARILLWRARADELALIDAFVARECDAEHADTPDLFLQLATPFERGYGHALREELCAQASEAEQSWACPAALKDEAESLLRALCSLHAQLAGSGDALLAVWLDPPIVTSDYALWLQRLAHLAPAQLRFIVVDTDAASLSALVDAEPVRVAAVTCALDMPGALDALTANGSTPGDLYRRLQVRLAAQLGEGDMASARATALAAVQLASSQGWAPLAASVQITLASAYAARGLHADAIAGYREADESATRCEEASLRDEIRLIARLGGASAMLAAGAHSLAADAYLGGALLAKGLADTARELDCYRLASFCCIQQGQRERAWALGVQGLHCALRMDASQRETSSLPYLAHQLESINDAGAPLEPQLVKMMGSDWRAQLSALD